MKLIIVSGISGVGKSTLVKQFIKKSEGKYELVRSMTTRRPRNVDDYYTFVTEKEFMNLYAQGAFLETNLYQGSKELYGTPRQEVERIITAGKIPVLEIDVHGKQQIECSKEQNGWNIISIFITVSVEIVYERLRDRGEPVVNIISRMKIAVEEIIAADKYTGVIENYDLEKALNDMRRIVNGLPSPMELDRSKYRRETIDLIERIEKTEEDE